MKKIFYYGTMTIAMSSISLTTISCSDWFEEREANYLHFFSIKKNQTISLAEEIIIEKAIYLDDQLNKGLTKEKIESEILNDYVALDENNNLILPTIRWDYDYKKIEDKYRPGTYVLTLEAEDDQGHIISKPIEIVLKPYQYITFELQDKSLPQEVGIKKIDDHHGMLTQKKDMLTISEQQFKDLFLVQEKQPKLDESEPEILPITPTFSWFKAYDSTKTGIYELIVQAQTTKTTPIQEFTYQLFIKVEE